MNFFIKKILFPSLIFILLFILIAYLTTKPTQKNEHNYKLKSYKNTVALYDNENIIKIYDNIVLNTLPPQDIQNFTIGIPFTSQKLAETYLEDFE
ncbi:MAG: hypothetical protein IKT42_02410 [Clostridia bacterium]|nr:hypothetical protein [Clostridia bacterium]